MNIHASLVRAGGLPYQRSNSLILSSTSLLEKAAVMTLTTHPFSMGESYYYARWQRYLRRLRATRGIVSILFQPQIKLDNRFSDFLLLWYNRVVGAD